MMALKKAYYILNTTAKNSLSFEIDASKDQDITVVAKVLKKYLADKANQLPAGVKLSPSLI